MTKADYINMAIAARTPFSEVIETAKRFEDYCGVKDELITHTHAGSVPIVYIVKEMSFNAGDMIEDADGDRWALVRSI